MNRTLSRILIPLSALSLLLSVAVAQPGAPLPPADNPPGAPPVFERDGAPGGPGFAAGPQTQAQGRRAQMALPGAQAMRGQDVPDRLERMRGMHEGGPELTPFWRRENVAMQLQLTDDQIKTFEAGYLKTRTSLIDLEAEAERGELALEEAMRPDVPDLDKVNAAIEKLGKARIEIQKTTAAQRVLVTSTFTPEQRAKAKELRREEMMRGQRERLMNENREQLRERWQNMDPDQKEKAKERLRDRVQDNRDKKDDVKKEDARKPEGKKAGEREGKKGEKKPDAMNE